MDESKVSECKHNINATICVDCRGSAVTKKEEVRPSEPVLGPPEIPRGSIVTILLDRVAKKKGSRLQVVGLPWQETIPLPPPLESPRTEVPSGRKKKSGPDDPPAETRPDEYTHPRKRSPLECRPAYKVSLTKFQEGGAGGRTFVSVEKRWE